LRSPLSPLPSDTAIRDWWFVVRVYSPHDTAIDNAEEVGHAALSAAAAVPFAGWAVTAVKGGEYAVRTPRPPRAGPRQRAKAADTGSNGAKVADPETVSEGWQRQQRHQGCGRQRIRSQCRLSQPRLRRRPAEG